MKFTQQRPFLAHLSSHKSGLILILSKEPALLKELLPLFKGEIIKFSAEKLTEVAYMQELHSLSLFGEERIVLVQGIEEAKEPLKKMLIESAAEKVPHLTRLFTATTLASNTLLYKAIDKHGVILDLASEKPWEKEEGLKRWLQAQPKKMEAAAIQLLLERTAGDFGTLQQEYEKLFCYTSGRDLIKRDDVERLTINQSHPTVWKLIDALLARDVRSTLQAGRALLEEGESLFPLIRLLRKQFETGYQMCEMRKKGFSREEIIAAFPMAKKLVGETASEERFRRGVILLDQLEVNLKNSGGREEVLWEQLLIQLSQ